MGGKSRRRAVWLSRNQWPGQGPGTDVAVWTSKPYRDGYDAWSSDDDPTAYVGTVSARVFDINVPTDRPIRVFLRAEPTW